MKYYQIASKHILDLDEGLPQTIKRKFGAVPVVEVDADADHAADTIVLSADANSATLYVPPAPTQAELLTARAAALLSEPASNLAEDVGRFLAQVQALALAGVEMTSPLTFRALMAAIEARWPDDKGQAAATGLKLRVAWDDIVYHCGSLRDADDLFPYLVAGVTK